MLMRGGYWTREELERSVKFHMDIDNKNKPLKEMRTGTIILEGDLRVKIRAFNSTQCAIRYGKHHRNEMILTRRFMNFRYLKEKVHAVTE